MYAYRYGKLARRNDQTPPAQSTLAGWPSVVARSALRRRQRSAATSNAGLELAGHATRVLVKLDRKGELSRPRGGASRACALRVFPALPRERAKDVASTPLDTRQSQDMERGLGMARIGAGRGCPAEDNAEPSNPLVPLGRRVASPRRRLCRKLHVQLLYPYLPLCITNTNIIGIVEVFDGPWWIERKSRGTVNGRAL